MTDLKGNPEKLHGIPVRRCNKLILDERDCIFLAVDECIKGQITDHLKDCKAVLIELDFYTMVYRDIYHCIKSFVSEFSIISPCINQPLSDSAERVVWGCWWQGEDSAPDMVKACWESQRQNLPENVRHVIITKKNYEQYITIPDIILEKWEEGKILTAHLTDFIRMSLLYKYGGLWLDADVLVLDKLPKECWELPLYTWHFDMTLFASETLWIIGFFAAKQGSILCKFVMEAFLYYFSIFDRINYYLMMDFFISICTKEIPGILEQFQMIPYNNEMAMRLIHHLHEPFSDEKFREYCEGSFLQVLTWKESGYENDSVFQNIIRTYVPR